ncbi:MAG: peptidylprolyl isomerase [Planctomycetes bacterium]|nr:peptidylprolyl isomerase [Planctomycetota bacterium]MCB9934483.1 peptidylprolyl isomerase [Planctomycetota bacterium]
MARHWFCRSLFVALIAAVCLVVGYQAGAQDVPGKGARNSLNPGEVMRVGHKVITSEQLIARMWDYEFMAQPEKRVLNDSLTYLRDTAVIELEAERLGGLNLTDEEIDRETDRQVEAIRQMVKQDTHGMLTLEDWLKQQNVGMDLEGFRAYVRERAPIFITRRVLVRYFEATEPSLECKHILLKTLSDANEVHKILKETAAKELDSKFEDLAVQRSIDPAAGMTRGKLPRIFENDGTLVKEAAEALWELKDGEYSEPIKTDFGWHIFKRDRTLVPLKKPLKELRDELMKQPDRSNENDYFNRWIRWVFNTRKYQYERRLPGFDCRPGQPNQEK